MSGVDGVGGMGMRVVAIVGKRQIEKTGPRVS
jgi:hypothetical protein